MLHNHTDGSILDGLSNVNDLASEASRLGLNSLAITDHGTMRNSIAFNMACRENGVKPIIGVEAYVDYGNNRPGHLTLLADGYTGYCELIKLNNKSHNNWVAGRPCITLSDIYECNKLVILTGCIASPFQQLPINDAIKEIKTLQSALQDRIFTEMMLIADNEDSVVRSLQLSQETGAKLVVTNDTHFVKKHHGPVHKLKMNFDYNSRELYLKSRSDYLMRLPMYPSLSLDVLNDALDRTEKLGDLIGSVQFNSKAMLPQIENASAQLLEIIKENEYKIPNGKLSDYWRRINEELETIRLFDFETYFVILHDVVSFAKSINCKVGPGRGSGSGSLVLFMLGVTEVDPIKHNLSFDRFLNKKRNSYPDVDIDFDSDKRERVMDYFSDKWGGYRVAAYSRYHHLSLIDALAPQLHISSNVASELKDMQPDSQEFLDVCDKYQEFKLAYNTMNGNIKAMSMHAGGMVILPPGLVAPIERRNSNSQSVVAFTEGLASHELGEIGAVKFDFLTLSQLTALSLLEQKYGNLVDNYNDSAVYEIFSNDSLIGIFQLGASSSSIEKTKALKIKDFETLTMANAIIRPGVSDGGVFKNLTKLINNNEVRKVNPLVDDILEETRGIIIYQEQVMSIFQRVLGGDFSDADLARRLLVKSKPNDPKWQSDFNKLKDRFLKNFPEGKDLWKEINKFVGYSFNKSHATAYSMITYQTAFWKKYYFGDFIAAMCTTYLEKGSNHPRIMELLLEAVSSGIEIVAPSVNSGTTHYNYSNGKLEAPLAGLNGIGDKTANIIADEVVNNGPYLSYYNFATRLPRKKINKRVKQILYTCGCFRGLQGNPDDIKIANTDVLSNDEVRSMFMNLDIPSKDQIEIINEHNNDKYICGYVSSVKEKQPRDKNKDKYKIFTLHDGSQWLTRKEVRQGTIVKFRKNKGNWLNAIGVMQNA